MRTRIIAGLVVSVLLAAPVVAIIYFAEKAFGLPFVPTNLMDWLIPIIPGDLITFGIDTMVDTIIALNIGNEGTIAKFIEGLMAIAIFMGITIALGTFYFGLRSRLPKFSNLPIEGLAIGLALGIPLVLISDNVLTSDNEFYAGPSFVARTAWIITLMAIWGVVLNLLYNHWNHLATTEPILEKQAVLDPIEITPKPEIVAITPVVSVKAITRRQFLIQLGGATATITVLGAGLGRLFIEDEQVIALDTNFSFLNFPNLNSLIIPAPGTRPEYTPIDEHYRIDINSGNPPEIDGEAWRLKITGLVEKDLELSLKDLQNKYTPIHQYVTLSCISNRIAGRLISTTGWTGIPLREILKQVKPAEKATHLKISSADGFFEYLSLELANTDERVMLTYAWNNELLRIKHGFPLRIYIPDRYGMKQPKWITEIEVVEEWNEGYWVQRGWSKEAIMRATSVVDTVAIEAVYEQTGQRFVPIGGIAHAGARSIARVEVQIDGGDWVEAQVRQPLSQTTWAIWRYDWLFEEGDHTFGVRCYDGNGELQIQEREGNRPNGATGIHSLDATL